MSTVVHHKLLFKKSQLLDDLDVEEAGVVWCYDLWWWWPLANRLETTKGQGELEEHDHMQRRLLTRLHRWETGFIDRMKWGES